MNNDLRDRVMQVIDSCRGSSQDFISAMDQAIEEDNLISPEEWRQNEQEICDIADNEIFTCATCSWTLNVDEMGEDTEGGELQCRDCE